MTILSGVKLKLYPNKVQRETIEQTFGNSRFVWNQFRNTQEKRYKAMIDDYNQYKEQAKETNQKIINPIYIDAYGMQKC
jgi:transposase